MIPADIDPSLCAAEPLPDNLDDGFSPPPRPDGEAGSPESEPPAQPSLGPKSLF